MYEKANAIIEAFKKQDDDLAVYEFQLRTSLNDLKHFTVQQNQFLWDALSEEAQYADFIERYLDIRIESHGK